MTHLPLINGTARHTANICRKTVQLGRGIYTKISFTVVYSLASAKEIYLSKVMCFPSDDLIICIFISTYFS